MKIIFYIRAIFHDCPNQQCDSVNLVLARKNFDAYSNIAHLEYRKKIHDIQMKCLSNISPHIIHNYKEIERNTFSLIHPTARDQILSLDDDDILIPLDDDDWLSPEIKHVNFNTGHITIWNCVSITDNGVFQHKKNIELPMVEIKKDTPAHLVASGLLSNCGAYRVGLLKYLAGPAPRNRLKLYDELDEFLQHHTRPRHVIRRAGNLGKFGENILDNNFAIYVKHAGSVTGVLAKLNTENMSKDIFDSVIARYRKLFIAPNEFIWAQEYFNQLHALNSSL
jgi:hypothetical protein